MAKKKYVTDDANKRVKEAIANTEWTTDDAKALTNVVVALNAKLGQRGSQFGYVLRAERSFGMRLYKATWPDIARGNVQTAPVATGLPEVKAFLHDEVARLEVTK